MDILGEDLEIWVKTVDLRLVRYSKPFISGRNGDAYDDVRMEVRLEQRHQSSNGREKWIPVEEVVDP